jgi:hypothetical protein
VELKICPLFLPLLLLLPGVVLLYRPLPILAAVKVLPAVFGIRLGSVVSE